MEYLINDTTLEDIADSIRAKDGTVADIQVSNFASRISAIPSGGTDNLAPMLNDTLTSIDDDNVTTLPVYAFYGRQNLEEVTFDNLTTMQETSDRRGQQFQNCTSLEKVDFSKLTNVAYGAFSGCTSLNDINLPLVTSVTLGIGSYGNQFYQVGKNSLTPFKLILPAYTVGFNCLSIFGECGATIISLPRATGGGWSNTFINCSNLEIVDLGSSTSIGTTQFANCSNLEKLVLRTTRSQLCTLSNVNAFDGTPFALDGDGGTIYVPENLIESYKIATNWSTLYDAEVVDFQKIEGTIYEDLDWADDYVL